LFGVGLRIRAAQAFVWGDASDESPMLARLDPVFQSDPEWFAGNRPLVSVFTFE
jgi:hypothetical protein